MKTKDAIYWTARFAILGLLGTLILYSSIALAMIMVRTLPFVTQFLSSQSNVISSAQGAQFISTVYPVSSTPVPLGQRIRIDPVLPLAIGISILRKIKPVDNLIKRFVPGPDNNGANSSNQNTINSSPFNLDIPDIPSTNQALNGIAPGDTGALSKVKGEFLNLGLAILFVLLVLLCTYIATSVLKSFVNMFNERSKDLVYGTAQLSDEIKALPTVVKEIQNGEVSVKKKSSATKK